MAAKKKTIKSKRAKKSSVLKEKPEIEAPVKKGLPVAATVTVIVLLAIGAYAAVKIIKNKKTAPAENSLSVSTIAEATATPAPAVTPAVKPTPKNSIPSKYRYLFKEYNTKEEIPKIQLEEAKVLYESGKALFVDARGVSEYNQSHIKGAVSIPVGTPPEKIKEMDEQLKGKTLVSYCHGAGCHLADKTAGALYDAGYKKVIIFFGGWPEWTQGNMPVETYQPPEKYAHLFKDINSVPEIQYISLDEAKFLYDMSLANFIDVDPVEKFSEIRLERSHSMPYDKLDEMLPGFINFIKEKPAVVYCQTDETKAVQAAEKMFNAGARKLLICKDAIKQWDAAGYPMFKNPR